MGFFIMYFIFYWVKGDKADWVGFFRDSLFFVGVVVFFGFFFMSVRIGF